MSEVLSTTLLQPAKAYDAMSDTQKMVYNLYHDENGFPINLTDGQDYLFRLIYGKPYPRVHVMNHTRYGKSMVVALAVLTRCAIFPEKWAIIAPEEKKAKIIMGYIIQHIFDNEFTANRFMPEEFETVDEIRRHKSKSHLTFVINPKEKDPTKRLLSEITVGSAKDALGYGAPNVIEDEAALIDDDEEALVARMLGDNPEKNFLVKIGNPFRRNHFLTSFRDPNYKRVVIDCYRSLKDGRMTQSFLDEVKKKPFFSILYECKFPPENAIDEFGYMSLLTEKELYGAIQRKFEPMGKGIIGLDVARGGRNFNVCVLRRQNWARILFKNNEENSVKIAELLIEFMKAEGIASEDVYIDDTGVGHGVVSVMKSRHYKVNAVNVGEKCLRPIDQTKYINIRAQMSSDLQTWLKYTGSLEPSEEWREILRVRYRKAKNGKIQIEPKEDLIKRGELSPDVFDAIALTFAKVKRSSYSVNVGAQTEGVFGVPESQFGGVPYFPGMPG